MKSKLRQSKQNYKLPVVFPLMWKYFLIIILLGVTKQGHAEIFAPLWEASSPRVQAVYWVAGNDPTTLAVTDIRGFTPLTLHFDILSNEDEDDNLPWLKASIRHCDITWQPENIPSSFYLKGFNMTDIGYGEPSIGGLSLLYRHYQLNLTDSDLRPFLSGNYMLQIYSDSDPDSIILAVPFLVEEGNATVTATVNPITDIDYKSQHQQLAIQINSEKLDSRVMPSDIQVLVGQNYTPGMWSILNHPSFISGNTAYYEHMNELIFPAGNEYRRIEVLDNDYPGMGVSSIEWNDPYYHQYLKSDINRSNIPYQTDFSNHGLFKLRERDSDDPDTEGDYSMVHFTLDGENIAPGTPIYIEGDFSQRSLTQGNRMLWGPDNNIYYLTLLMKHGAYSYRYLTPTLPNPFYTEGNFFQTSNLYPVAVYYRIPGEKFDRLACFTVIPSIQ